VGTSGALQASTKLGTAIVTSYAIGIDNTGLFYEAPHADEASQRIERELGQVFKRTMRESSRFYAKIQPYVARAEPALVDALLEASASLGAPSKPGLTVSCPGFFAPQGRDIARLRPSVPDLDRLLSDYDPRLGGQRVENMEMESSFLIHFLVGLGHWAGAICPVIANRRQNTFDHHYQQAVENAIRVGLLALATLRDRYGDARIG
jgi:uridine phosphorylase